MNRGLRVVIQDFMCVCVRGVRAFCTYSTKELEQAHAECKEQVECRIWFSGKCMNRRPGVGCKDPTLPRAKEALGARVSGEKVEIP